jgi:hypothetical protein
MDALRWTLTGRHLYHSHVLPLIHELLKNSFPSLLSVLSSSKTESLPDLDRSVWENSPSVAGKRVRFLLPFIIEMPIDSKILAGPLLNAICKQSGVLDSLYKQVRDEVSKVLLVVTRTDLGTTLFSPRFFQSKLPSATTTSLKTPIASSKATVDYISYITTLFKQYQQRNFSSTKSIATEDDEKVRPLSFPFPFLLSLAVLTISYL